MTGRQAAERVTGAVAHHGEGPVWDADAAVLRWVDLLAGDLLELTTTGQVVRRHVAPVLAAWRPRAGGGLVAAVERGFALVEPDLRTVRTLPELWTDPSVRMNDGACDPRGRFYCGGMAYDARPGAGQLHRLDPDGSTHVVLTGVTVSNGLVFDRDGTRAYYVDSATGGVDVFDVDPTDGAFDARRRLVTVDPGLGVPDGMTVDAEGGLWVALWDGAAVHRYTADGVLDAVVTLPTPRVTACAFGGTDLDELYISTSRLGLDGDDGVAGSLFVVRPGLRGRPLPTFAG